MRPFNASPSFAAASFASRAFDRRQPLIHFGF